MNNYFVIKHNGSGEVARFVDATALNGLNDLLISLVRQGFTVEYTAQPLAIVAPVTQAKPTKARKARATAGQAKRRKPGLRARRMSAANPATDRPGPALAAILAANGGANGASDVPRGKTWKQGDIVFVAWRDLASDNARAYLEEKREAMGVVEEFRSGPGIRRTVGVRFDTDAYLTWCAPAELSEDCQYCKEERDGK